MLGQTGGLLRQVGEFGKIAALGGRGPARHARQQARGAALRPEQGSLLSRELEAMAAQIIGATLEQGDFRRQPKAFASSGTSRRNS